MSPDADLGELAGDAAAAEAFWLGAFDEHGILTTPHGGAIWEAVETARAVGQRGQGRIVAILDGHFDVSALPADRIHPASEPGELGPVSRHGTTVARLVNNVAPDAQLLLLNVMRGDHPSQISVGLAIDKAAAAGADVINLSLAFVSDCPPRAGGWSDPEVLFAADPDPDAFLAVVDAWRANTEPYAGDRCARPCAVCDALERLPASTAVFAAAGNQDQLACPACFRSVVGIGFHRSATQARNGGVIDGPVFVGVQNLLHLETTVDVPPGFEGTSFASPLLAGLAALVPDRSVIAELVRLSMAVIPLVQLRGTITDDSTAPERPVHTVLSGLMRLAKWFPEAHQHWKPGTLVPCVSCSLLLRDWYLTWVSVLVQWRFDDALIAARLAVAVAPQSALHAGNLGLALRVAALKSTGPESVELLEASAAELERAATLAGESAVADYYRGLIPETARSEGP